MNKKYGKLVEGVLTFAPINLVVDDMQIINAEEADYISAGYLPIQYTIKPDDNEWQAVYTEVDGVILQSWVYEGRIHDHSNLPLLEGVTAKSLSGVPAVHHLPIEAKDGDLCLYAPMNILTLKDSGKRIYFDWEIFSNTITTDDPYAAYSVGGSGSSEVGNTNLFFNISYSQIGSSIGFQISSQNNLESYTILFENGKLNTEHSVYQCLYSNGEEVMTYYNNINELPLYLDLPKCEHFEFGVLENNTSEVPLFYTEYRLMKYQGGEWGEVFGTSTKDYIDNALAEINARIDGIEGGIDEIEAMIDESGVLDE